MKIFQIAYSVCIAITTKITLETGMSFILSNIQNLIKVNLIAQSLSANLIISRIPFAFSPYIN